MKKCITIISILTVLFSIYGCSINNSELQALKQENESLKSNNISYESNLSELKKENESLKNELDELKNGAERRINEIKDAFNKKDFDKVIELSKTLSKNHPRSNEAIEAEGLVVQIETIRKEEQKKANEEAEKARKEAEKSAIDKAREIIRVKSVYPSEPNSAGGVDLYIVWQNKSSKTIKYVYFEVEPYNAVDDVVSCSIRSNSVFRGQETGPVKTNQWRGDGEYWECAWYNNTITKVKLLQIDIEYMDGTSASLSDNDIEYVRY